MPVRRGALHVPPLVAGPLLEDRCGHLWLKRWSAGVLHGGNAYLRGLLETEGLESL